MNIDLTKLSEFMKEENKLLKKQYELQKPTNEPKDDLRAEIFRMTAEVNEMRKNMEKK